MMIMMTKFKEKYILFNKKIFVDFDYEEKNKNLNRVIDFSFIKKYWYFLKFYSNKHIIFYIIYNY